MNQAEILEASYLNQKESRKRLKKLGYKYDKKLSTNESKVFIDNNGNPSIAFRGSKRVSDFLGSDVKLALGLEQYDRRFKEAKHLTSLVEEKYGRPANVFGHSLAGSLAEKSGAHGTITTYNKGVGLFDIGKTIPKNQTDYRTVNDPVSLLSLTQNYKYNNLIQNDSGKDVFDIRGNHARPST